jgi:MSHA pilin protein MshC
MRPGSGESSYQGSLSGVSLTSATLYFSAKGQASADINIDIGTRRITVVSSTGFVYDSTP